MKTFNEAFEAALSAVNELAAHPDSTVESRLWALKAVRMKTAQRELDVASNGWDVLKKAEAAES